MLRNKGPQAVDHLGDGLQEFRLPGVAVGDVLQELLGVGVFHDEWF
jgi:hypothetical protein